MPCLYSKKNIITLGRVEWLELSRAQIDCQKTGLRKEIQTNEQNYKYLVPYLSKKKMF